MVINRSQIHSASLYCTLVKRGFIQQHNVFPISMTPKHEDEYCDKKNKENPLNVKKTEYVKTSLKFNTKANKLHLRIGNSGLFHQAPVTTSTYGQQMRCFSSTAAVSTGSEAYGIVSNILTYVATSKPTLCIGEALCWIHDTTGFHWYTTIICSTIVFRFMFMGQAHITSKKVANKRRILYKNMEELIPHLRQNMFKLAAKNKWNDEKIRKQWNWSINEIMRHNSIKYNCAPQKMYMPFLVQIPVWICTSMALRNMSTMRLVHEDSWGKEVMEAKFRFLQMSNEGFGWISNLTLTDKTWIVPCIVGISYFVNNEISQARYKRDFIDKGKTSKVQSAPKTLDMPQDKKQRKEHFSKDVDKIKSQITEQDIVGSIKPSTNRTPNIEQIVAASQASKLKEEYQRLKETKAIQKFWKYDPIGNFFRVYSIFMIPLAATVPSAVSLYWASSGVAGILVNLTLLSPKVKKLVRIPEVEKISGNPYIELANNIKTRWSKIMKKNKE